LDVENLSALNVFALPFVVAPARRRPWLWAQTGIFCVQLTFGWMNLRDPAQWGRLSTVLATNPGLLLSALAAGILQCAGIAFAKLLIPCHAQGPNRIRADLPPNLKQTRLALAGGVLRGLPDPDHSAFRAKRADPAAPRGERCLSLQDGLYR
jgi:hypothetical protein